MPEETRYYLPKLMAVRNIVFSPELHGVELADIPNTPYFAGVDVPVPLDLQSIARMAGLTTAEVLALNPSHKSQYISGKGKPAVLLPADRIEAFEQNMATYAVNARELRKRDVRKGKQRTIAGFKALEAKPL
jgi:membrane-bound lytic murein transglycosylase D